MKYEWHSGLGKLIEPVGHDRLTLYLQKVILSVSSSRGMGGKVEAPHFYLLYIVLNHKENQKIK